jgi:cell division transport system permease protein
MEFYLKEAFLGLSRNRLMTFVALGTIIVSLIIYGLVILGLYNVYNITKSFESKLYIMAYLKDDVDDVTINRIKPLILSNVGVKKVEFLDKETSWQNFRKKFEKNLQILDYDSTNPLPDAFKVEATNVEQVENVAVFLKNLDGVEEVRYGLGMAEKLKHLIKSMEIGGLVLVSLLGAATLLIIVNTIRLTVLARQNEIVIMQLVGATDGFIEWPFIIEGIVLGLSGAICASIVLKYVYEAVALRISQSISFLVIVTGGRVLTYIYLSVIVIGTLLGMLGGYISVSRSLKMMNK